MAPEVLHIHRFRAAGDAERRIAVAFGIRIQNGIAIHIAYHLLGVHIEIALAAFRIIQTHIILFKHIQVQMQHRRAFDNLIADIIAAVFKARRGIAVEILKPVFLKIEIRNGDLHVRKHGLIGIVAHNGNAVIR